MNRTLLVCAAVLALSAPAVMAQEPPAPATTFSAPRVIDVVVTDLRGNRIPGLTASDFQIVQSGKPQEITNFTALTRPADAVDTHPARRILFAFDMSSLSMQGRKKSVEAARALVKARIRPVDRVMVAQVSSVGSANPVGSWTYDPAEIEKQFTTIEGLNVTNRSVDRKNAEQQIQNAIGFSEQSSAAPVGFETLMQAGRQYAGAAQAETLRTINAIQDMFGLMGEGPGKKIVILAGGGLSTRPGAEIFEYLENIKMQAEMGQIGGATLQLSSRSANPRTEIARFEVGQEVRDLTEIARNHGVVVYAVEPDTSASTQLAVERQEVEDKTADFAGVADQMSGYNLLCAATGGLALIGGTSDNVVRQIAGDFDTHYALSFVQTVPATGAIPKVDVKMTKPGYRVRSAFAGGPSTKDSEVKEAVVAHQIAALASNDLNIAVKKEEPVADGDNRRVTLTVMIPIKSLKLTPAGDEVTGSFAVYICTGDAKGNASPVNRQTKEVRFPASAVPQLMEKSIGFRVDVSLIPGRTQISVGVLDEKSEQTGYAKVTI